MPQQREKISDRLIIQVSASERLFRFMFKSSSSLIRFIRRGDFAGSGGSHFGNGHASRLLLNETLCLLDFTSIWWLLELGQHADRFGQRDAQCQSI